MSKILFITDSAADIPAELREGLEIKVLPFMISMNEKEYRDCVDFTPKEKAFEADSVDKFVKKILKNLKNQLDIDLRS